MKEMVTVTAKQESMLIRPAERTLESLRPIRTTVEESAMKNAPLMAKKTTTCGLHTAKVQNVS
jgi:hypothetical protein